MAIKVISPDVSFSLVRTEVAVPDTSLSNLDILRSSPAWKDRSESFLANMDQRIRDSYGYIRRFVAHAPYLQKDDGTTSESLAHAALDRLIRADVFKTLAPEFLVHGTTTSSRYSSTQSAALLSRLGIEMPAPEVKAGCGTGMLAMQTALGYLRSGYSAGVVVISETLSRLLDPGNVASWVGLADAAAALVISKDKTPGGLWVKCEKSLHYTDGSGFDLMTTRGTLPLQRGNRVDNEFVLSGDQESFSIMARSHYLKIIENILPSPKDRQSVDWILAHQVNRSLIEDCIQQAQVSGKTFWVNEEYGNVGSVSIPLCLHEGLKKEIFKPGDRILLMTVGGGMNCVAMIWTVQ